MGSFWKITVTTHPDRSPWYRLAYVTRRFLKGYISTELHEGWRGFQTVSREKSPPQNFFLGESMDRENEDFSSFAPPWKTALPLLRVLRRQKTRLRVQTVQVRVCRKTPKNSGKERWKDYSPTEVFLQPIVDS